MRNCFIKIEDVRDLKNPILIDVRSPSEFNDATIPKAINIPLLDDYERAQVGIVYKNVCKKEAERLGYDFVNPKISDIIQKLKKLEQKYSDVILFCWRGGLRSQNLTAYCNNEGIKIKYLKGGYKAYRRSVYAFLSDKGNIPQAVVLLGLTGVGKTRLLDNLSNYNLPIIDLEGLVENRGSVFGEIPGGKQPSQKNFEASLYDFIFKNKEGYFIVECESQKIGKLYLPKAFFAKMQEGIKIHLYADFNTRVERVVEDYACYPTEKLLTSLCFLQERLGSKKVTLLKDLINKESYYDAVAILLKEYYDPLYGYSENKSESHSLSVNCNNLEGATAQIYGFLSCR